jgi:HSP20 family protein
LRNEYRFRSFKRNFTLNENINAEGITARYNDGILNVMLPKKEATEKTTKDITVA